MNEQAILQAIAAELDRPVETLAPGTRFADLGVDSLDFVRVVQAVEEASGARLDDKEAAAAETVGALLALVHQAGS